MVKLNHDKHQKFFLMRMYTFSKIEEHKTTQEGGKSMGLEVVLALVAIYVIIRFVWRMIKGAIGIAIDFFVAAPVLAIALILALL